MSNSDGDPPKGNWRRKVSTGKRPRPSSNSQQARRPASGQRPASGKRPASGQRPASGRPKRPPTDERATQSDERRARRPLAQSGRPASKPPSSSDQLASQGRSARRRIEFGELTTADDFFADFSSADKVGPNIPPPEEPIDELDLDVSDYPELDTEADTRRSKQLAELRARKERERRAANPRQAPRQRKSPPSRGEQTARGPVGDDPRRRSASARPARPAPPDRQTQQLLIALQQKIRDLENKLDKVQSQPAQSPSIAAAPAAKAPDKDDEQRDLLPMTWGLENAQTEQIIGRKNRIDFFLRLMLDRGASDFHLHVGNSPIFRQSGNIAPMRYRPLRQRDWERLVRPITPEPLWEAYQSGGDMDFAYEIPGAARFRVNLMKQHRGGGAVFRVIPSKILTLEQLGLPPSVNRFAELDNGLVLVTGPTGSGKSTTLAAIIDLINRRKANHIITVEDPIEFVHKPQRSLLHQREVGTHTVEFNDALKASIREDPDLILVGEMRDRETMLLALQAAEKGMLVFGTLHTNSAAKTVDRIINAFPSEEQEQIRAVLAGTLQGVVSQQLLRRVNGGRVAALEILFSSRAMGNLIREGKTHHIPSLMQTGRKVGMVQMDESLMKLIKRGIITREAALEKAIEKEPFKDEALDEYIDNPIDESEDP